MKQKDTDMSAGKKTRFAALYSPTTGDLAAVAVEATNCVAVYAKAEERLPRRIEEPIRVVGLDLETHEYGPGTPEYFDLVLSRLSRSFGVGERGGNHDEEGGQVCRELITQAMGSVVTPRSVRYGGAEEKSVPPAKVVFRSSPAERSLEKEADVNERSGLVTAA